MASSVVQYLMHFHTVERLHALHGAIPRPGAGEGQCARSVVACGGGDQEEGEAETSPEPLDACVSEMP